MESDARGVKHEILCRLIAVVIICCNKKSDVAWNNWQSIRSCFLLREYDYPNRLSNGTHVSIVQGSNYTYNIIRYRKIMRIFRNRLGRGASP